MDAGTQSTTYNPQAGKRVSALSGAGASESAGDKAPARQKTLSRVHAPDYSLPALYRAAISESGTGS